MVDLDDAGLVHVPGDLCTVVDVLGRDKNVFVAILAGPATGALEQSLGTRALAGLAGGMGGGSGLTEVGRTTNEDSGGGLNNSQWGRGGAG